MKVSKEEAKKIIIEVDDLTARIIRVEPTVAVLAERLGIKVTHQVKTAAITEDFYLLINPQFWEPRNDDQKTLVLGHEYSHGVLSHTERIKNVSNPIVYNWAADVIVNRVSRYITEKSKESGAPEIQELWELLWTDDKIRNIVKSTGIQLPGELEKLSAEELYEWLMEVITRHKNKKQQKQGQSLSFPGMPLPQNGQGHRGAQGQSQSQSQNQNQQNQNQDQDQEGEGQGQGQSSSSDQERSGNQGGNGNQKEEEQGQAGSQEQEQKDKQNQTQKKQGDQGQSQKKEEQGQGQQQKHEQGQGQGQKQEQGQQGQGQGSCQGQNKGANQNKQGEGQQIKNRDIIKRASDVDGAVIKEPSLTDEEKKDLQRTWQKVIEDAYSLARTLKKAGRGSAMTDALIKAIEGNIIQWSKVIRDVLEKDYKYRVRTFRRPSRRLKSKKVIYPGRQRKPVPKLIVFVDVSGSMDEQELSRGIGELMTFVQKYRGKLIIVQWDDGLISVREIKRRQELEEWHREGSGGTNFTRSFEDFKKTQYFKELDGSYALIISDFYWSDVDEGAKTIRYLASKSLKVLGYDTTKSGKEAVAYNWRQVASFIH